MKARALKFVRFERVEDHFKLGWVMSFPNSPMHHHHYGVEMKWICDCPVPGGFKFDRSTKQPQRSNHGRSRETV